MKISSLFDRIAFERFLDSAKRPGFVDSRHVPTSFQDADPGLVLERNLEHIDPTIFQKKFPELAFVNSGITVDNSGGFVELITSLRTRPTGSFRTSGDKSDDKGKISLAADSQFIRVLNREAESDWTDTEIRQASLQNINLPSQFVATHNEIYLREIDLIGFLGVPDYSGSVGLLNYTGFTSVAATGAIGGLTAQQMYDDFAGLITDQRNGVNNTPEYSTNRVTMPVYVMNELQATILNTAAGSSTVFRALQDNFPGVEFSATPRADDAGGAGVSHTIAYNNNSEAMKMRIPHPLEIGEVIRPTSFKFHVESRYRVAGLDILEDTAGRILTGL